MNDIQNRQVTLVTVGVLNKSTLLSADDWRAMIGLANVWLEQVGAVWGIWWACAEAADEAALSSYKIQFVIADGLPQDEPGALGYHTEQADGGIRAYIAVQPVLKAGGVALIDPANPQNPSVLGVFTHELGEALADAFCNLFALGPERKEGALFAYEICDPVEAWQYEVTLPDGSAKGAASDWVYPEWFDLNAPEGTQVDKMGRCSKPFEIASGGYMSVMNSSYSLTQIYGDTRRPWKESGEVTSLRSRRRAAHVAALAARAKR